MPLSSQQMLQQLGAKVSIENVCEAAGMSRPEFDAWWQNETKQRTPNPDATTKGAVGKHVSITRDSLGIPRIAAESDDDLFFGFGYAMAQDRLFQMDYLRRRGAGTLSEILGADGVELDMIARTVGLPAIAAREWEGIPEETRRLMLAFAAGVNAFLDDNRQNLPIEFALLDYTPSAWHPVDSLLIAGEFRWYLTGRFPVIAIPELAKRTLKDKTLYHAFLETEAEDEAILPPGTYPTRPATESLPTGGGPDDGSGSNNWVVAGARTTTGAPLLASDPHIAFAAVSCWYEVQLSGGTFQVSGMAYAGMPAVMFGRNPKLAWGITNNICSVRDLYKEQTDAAHPDAFLYDGEWEPATSRTEKIVVRDQEPISLTVKSSRNGPIVDAILPEPVRQFGPVSLRWQGAEFCNWMTALLGMGRAESVDAFSKAMDGWLVPTFSLVMADVTGQIGYKASGRLPIRRVWERGYREGWNPQHAWDGYIPVDEMPQLFNPERGFMVTANNRVAGEDFPHPLSGTWNNGQRCRRVRQMIEEKPKLSVEDFQRMHQDALSLRAVGCVPMILSVLSDTTNVKVKAAVEILRVWDCQMETDRVGASLFDLFFSQWSKVVAGERFGPEEVAFLSGAIGGLATILLETNKAEWFPSDEARRSAIHKAMELTVSQLETQLGTDMSQWGWGALHQVVQKHFLSGRGDLGLLFDRGGLPVKGDGVTICNTGFDPNWGASMGAGYRLIADLSDPQGTLYAIDAGAESGNPGSPHYDDQLQTWLSGGYHSLYSNGETEVATITTLEPK